MKIINYYYSHSVEKTIDKTAVSLKDYLKKGWIIVCESNTFKGRLIIRKPAEATVSIKLDNGEVVLMEVKDLILNLYQKKRISVQLFEKFIEDTNNGKWELTFDKNDNLIGFRKE